MNADTMLKHFDRISEAPDAVPRLRRFILDLAVRGKLVEQDPSDEQVGELLKRIHAEKAKLVKDGKIKEQKELTNRITKFPYKLPVSWQWVPLGITVNCHLGGGTPSKNNSSYWDGDIFWASVKDIGKGKYVDETIDRISNAGLKDSSSNLIPPGNLIVVTRMGLGKISINRVPIAINQDLRALSLSSQASIDYCYNFFKTHGFAGSGLTVKGIKVEELLNTPFPLPPLAEQHRIVAKVDELMALCDQMEAARNKREMQRGRLVAASLNRINTTSADDAKVATRFHLDNLPHLTTRPEHIKQLRQTILNLAVRGQIVPQDPNDELAAELLQRIEVVKQRLIDEGTIKKQKPQPTLTIEEKPFPLPEHWTWVRLSNITDVQDPNPSHRMPEYVQTGGVPFISSENFADGDKINFHIGKRITQKTLDEQIARFPILSGALAFTRIGTIGKSRFLPAERTYGISHAVCVLNPIDESTLSMQFLRLALRVESILAFAHHGTRSIGVPDLGMAVVRGMAIPFPPLAEQHRIVAKVDELMALCDQLEAQLTATEADSRRLLEAVLRDALNPVIKEEAA